MTSLFEQYEQESQRYVSNARDKNSHATYSQKDEKPIFQKNRISFEFSAPILHLAICNEYLVYVTSNNILWRRDLKSDHKQAEIDLNRVVPGVKLTGLFLNPTADHLLIGFSTELLYLNQKFSKPKPTSKLRGHEITAVGWNLSIEQFGESSTKPILLGTSRGIIFEVEISADEGIFTSSIESYCKQVFDVGKGSPHAITGLQYCRVGRSDRYFVLATTVDRLFKFVGSNSGSDERPLLQQLFNKYLGLPEGFQEIPSSLDYSCLQLYTAPHKTTPTAIGWLTETGIFYAQIDASNDELLSKTKMISLPEGDPPTGFLITDFHILLLYRHHIAVLSSLTESLICTDHYSEVHGSLLNIIRDPVKGTIWVYAEKAVFRYRINNEDRDVWKIYADKGDFAMAKRYCKDNSENMDKVLVMQAEHYFQQKQYKEAALCYANSQAPFEKVALELVRCDGAPPGVIQEALKAFLREKLKKARMEDQAQTTMLVLWLLQLILHRLGELRMRGLAQDDEFVLLQAELDEFITDTHVLKCIRSNKRVVYELIASHGDEENMVKLAKLTEDYKKVVEHYVYKGDYRQALDTLKEQSSAELWYTFVPELIDAEPRDTLAAVRLLGRPLDPCRLLPALIAAADGSQPEELIRYLEYCINDLNCQEQAVHNLFLYLLAHHRPDRLIMYLSVQGEEKSMVNYDVAYALRTCLQLGRREASVRLSMMLGLWEAAVDLALSVSVQLAVQTVSQLQGPQRALWLKIAQHVVKEQNNISQAMQFFSQSELKIEDILPFFPDFVTIDHFKDAICSSLQQYNQHIQDLKEEMEDATKSAEVIRNEIQTFRSKYSVIMSTDSCCLCDLLLLLRPFYSFPCGHRFHSDCLLQEVIQLLPEKKKNELTFLKRHLESNLIESEKEKTRLEIDAILANQCLFCGDLMIDLIDKPFISEEDYERIKKEWE